jgi:hypothetical protein
MLPFFCARGPARRRLPPRWQDAIIGDAPGAGIPDAFLVLPCRCPLEVVMSAVELITDGKADKRDKNDDEDRG